jgi:hypothetical protein
MATAIPDTNLELSEPRMLLICVAHDEKLARIAACLFLMVKLSSVSHKISYF